VKTIGIALFDGFSLPEIARLLESFQCANEISQSDQRGERTRFKVRLLSTLGGRIGSSSCVFVWTESIDSGEHLGRLHGLFVAGGAGVGRALGDEVFLAWLRRTCALTRNVFSVGEGRLLLDAAGHKRHSRKALDADEASSIAEFCGSLKIGQGSTLSPSHSALWMIEREEEERATHGMTELSLPFTPDGFISTILRNGVNSASEKIRVSARWLETNGHRPVCIVEAARVVTMSERNFLRRFKAELGMTPSNYLLYVRLDNSCRMLAETSLPVGVVARRCGIGSSGQLARLFRKHLGKSPTAYRASYRSSERTKHDRLSVRCPVDKKVEGPPIRTRR
jgi:transcriptional regulator GlxA family with amidase domain